VVSKLADAEPETRIGGLAGVAKDVLPCIAIELTDNAAVFVVKEGAPFTVERGQVLLRAFEAPVDGF
jgi:hypothetical protein